MQLNGDCYRNRRELEFRPEIPRGRRRLRKVGRNSDASTGDAESKDNPMHEPYNQPVSPIAFRLMRSLTIIDSSVVGFRPRISAAPAFPRIRHPVISSTLTR